MDRLPKENSLEALRTLRSAWDTIDVCVLVSRRNKFISKGAYLTLLLLGIVTTTVATFVATGILPDREEAAGSSVLNGAGSYGITALSLLTSVCVGVISFLSPVQKWQQLRSTASQLESETWRFRTRTGPYSRPANGGRDRGCDRVLIAEMHRIRRSVIESATIKDTSFFRSRATHVYCHGQRKESVFDTTASGDRDNFYSVLRPDDYIELRVRPSLRFASPRFARCHSCQLVAMCRLSTSSPCYIDSPLCLITIHRLTTSSPNYIASPRGSCTSPCADSTRLAFRGIIGVRRNRALPTPSPIPPHLHTRTHTHTHAHTRVHA